jgi:hypothetical protein
MSQAISGASVSSFSSELAALLIENESTQAESAHQDRTAAREMFLDQAQQQVDALHAAASAVMTGALVSAAFTTVSAGFTIGAACASYSADMKQAEAKSLGDSPCFASKVHDLSKAAAAASENAGFLAAAGKGFGELAAPAKAFAGDSVSADFQAEAKRHETLAEQAKWQASDASSAIDKAEKQTDKVIDFLQGMQRDDNSSASAIIGRI